MRWLWTLLVVLLCTGCTEYGYRMNELVGLNCRPAVMQEVGSCVAVNKEAKR